MQDGQSRSARRGSVRLATSCAEANVGDCRPVIARACALVGAEHYRDSLAMREASLRGGLGLVPCEIPGCLQ